jgi:hypothetical protein
VNATNQSLDQIRANLDQRLRARELEGYLILPPDFLSRERPNSLIATRAILFPAGVYSQP